MTDAAEKLTQGEKNKATRVRKRIRGGTEKNGDREWLAEYEAKKQRLKAARENKISAPVGDDKNHPGDAATGGHPNSPLEWNPSDGKEVGASEGGDEPGTVVGPSGQGASSPSGDSSPPRNEQKEVATPREESSAKSTLVDLSKPDPEPSGQKSPGGKVLAFPKTEGITQKCGDPDCVHCYGPVKRMCPVTQKPVYPKMKKTAAKALVRMVFGGIDWFMERRYDIEFEPPDQDRIDDTAEGLRGVLHKYAGPVGMFDDELSTLGGIGGHIANRGDAIKNEKTGKGK